MLRGWGKGGRENSVERVSAQTPWDGVSRGDRESESVPKRGGGRRGMRPGVRESVGGKEEGVERPGSGGNNVSEEENGADSFDYCGGWNRGRRCGSEARVGGRPEID